MSTDANVIGSPAPATSGAPGTATDETAPLAKLDAFNKLQGTMMGLQIASSFVSAIGGFVTLYMNERLKESQLDGQAALATINNTYASDKADADGAMVVQLQKISGEANAAQLDLANATSTKLQAQASAAESIKTAEYKKSITNSQAPLDRLFLRDPRSSYPSGSPLV